MRLPRLLYVLLCGATSWAVDAAFDPPPVVAQEQAADMVEGEDGSDLPPGFEPIRGKEASAQVDPNPLVVMAYGAILAGLFIYVILVVRRQGRLSREVAELAKEVERRGN
jgi:hypothetical protein